MTQQTRSDPGSIPGTAKSEISAGSNPALRVKLFVFLLFLILDYFSIFLILFYFWIFTIVGNTDANMNMKEI